MQADDASFKEAVQRILKSYQGKYVNTSIGRVLFNAVSSSELQLGTKENKIRASLVAFVPQTLQEGNYQGRLPLENPSQKSKEKGKFVAFHSFQNTVVIDNKEINHVVKVGERENGEFVFIAYHSKAAFDQTNWKETYQAPDTVSRIKAGRSEAENVSLDNNIMHDAKNVNTVFDDIEDGKEGWNIEIISIRELDAPIDQSGEEGEPEGDENKQPIPAPAAPDENQPAAETPEAFGNRVAGTDETAKQQAIQYLNAIISGEIDGMESGVLPRLLELVEPFEDDAEINKLADKASAVIEAAMPKEIA